MPRSNSEEVEQLNFNWLVDSSMDLMRNVLSSRNGIKIAAVSSFGTQSAPLLHMISKIDPTMPVMFIDTKMMFQETLDYRKELTEILGLEDVRIVSPDLNTVRRNDTFGRLHLNSPDQCCNMRKVAPLSQALEGFDGWINGRKRHQTAEREMMLPVELDDLGRIKVNPLAAWQDADIVRYFEEHDLPIHPLTHQGFHSIGCAACTARAADRSGRWSGSEKTECGIHFGPAGGNDKKAA